MKKCCTCKLELDNTKFSKRSSAKDGLAANCKECAKAYAKKWNIENNAEQLIKKKIYREQNSEAISETKKEWYENNKEHARNRNRQNYHNKKEHYKQKTKEYYQANRSKGLEDRRNHYQKNKSHYNELGKQWRKENRDLCNFYSRTYDAAKLQATPNWLTEEHLNQIKEFYTEAQELKWLNEGLAFHVDHIVPIQGDNVCGLHVPWNLQLLSPVNNHKKNNRF